MLFGKYCLLERVSVGGMAEIFRAKPFNAPATQKHLALKRILPHLAEDDEFVQMFIDEATLTVQLLHPNIVRTWELGRFHTSPYILMEFISGHDLLELQRRLRAQQMVMDVAMACYIVREIALGMDYVHAKTDENGQPLHIIHRDISPQNILVTYGGNVKIIDFGIAKGTFQETRTQVGVLKGKFGYMSPEQVRGLNIDHRSDLFSIGTLLWELLTNRRLFRGSNEYETIQLLREPTIVAPSEYNPAIPAEVDRIVARSLAAEREERYQSGGELAADLLRYLNAGAQPFGSAEMSAWMSQTFGEEIEAERHKRAYFRDINTPEDVLRAGRVAAGEDTQPDASAGRERSGGSTVWDSSIAPEEGADAIQFASEHTIVAAGGFDMSAFAAETEEDVMLLEADDIVEIEDLDDAAWPGGRRGAQPEQSAQLPSLAGWGDPEVQNHQTQAIPRPAEMDSAAFSAPNTPARGAHVPASVPLNRKKLLAAGLVILLLCLVAAAAASLWSGREASSQIQAAVLPPPPQAATLVVSVSPPTGLKILVDGVNQGDAAPVTMLDLQPGAHTLEISHPSYDPHHQQLELTAGGFKSIYVELKPRL